MKQPKIYVTGVPKGQGKEIVGKKAEKILEKIMAKNFYILD